jgi:hypothetical protein
MRTFKFYDLITVVALSLSFSFFGCVPGPGGGSGGSGGSGSPVDDNGTAPSILDIKLFKIVDDAPIESSSFNIGDITNMSMIANDLDLDMNTLFISKFLLPDLDSPFVPTSEIILPTQTYHTIEYYFIEPIDIEGPAGDWQICFLIVDKAGNESNEVCINITIHEAEAATTAIANLNMSLSSGGAFDFSKNKIES